MKKVWKLTAVVTMTLLFAGKPACAMIKMSAPDRPVMIAESGNGTNATAPSNNRPDPVNIFIDGQAVDFEGEPVMVRGTTMVPFRPLFQKLGFAVLWDNDARKVTARKTGQTIELTVDGQTALINGQAMTMAIPPFVRDGKTYVPLRFVAEQTGREASWDANTREIYIADTKGMIDHVLDKHLDALVSGDQAALLRTLAPDTALHIEQELDGVWPTGDGVQLSLTSRLLEHKADQALAEATITLRDPAEPQHPQARTTTHYRMVRVSGEWKVHSQDVQLVEYLAGRQSRQGIGATAQSNNADALSDEDRQAIMDVLEQSRVHLETEDVEAEWLLYLEEDSNLVDRMSTMEALFDRYDFWADYGEIVILSGSPEEAHVKVTLLLRKVGGPFFKDALHTAEVSFVKTEDGVWKIAAASLLSTDFRTDAIIDFLETYWY